MLALFLLWPLSDARAQDAGAPGGIGIRPAAGSPFSAHEDDWFAVVADPGQQVELDALVSNPGDTPQRVRLYLLDLTFDDEGRPTLGERPTGVGAWGQFAEPAVTVGARSERVVRFAVRVPEGTDPGDHIGAVVAEGEPVGGGSVPVVFRVAARLYVTVPGDVRTGIEIERVDVEPRGWVFPRIADVSVVVRNTGSVRLEPIVTVGGHRADGAAIVLSRSGERYVATYRVPPWGGPIDVDVKVTSRSPVGEGPEDTASGGAFVLPIVPVLALVLAALGVESGRRLLRNRRGRVAALEAELDELRRRVGA